MKRALISFLIIGLHTLLLTIALRIPVAANTQHQTVAQPGEPTAAPVTISVRQQLPLTITIQSSATTTATESSTETIAVTLDLQFDLTVTDTVTATVPSTVTVTFADQQTSTMAVSLTVGLSPTAVVRVTVPTTAPAITSPITATDALTTATTVTPTALLTPAFGLTTTVPPQVLNPTVVSSVAITTNLRSGPDTTFDVQTRIGPGTEILVVAQNADGTWYLLNNGLWLAAFLVDTPPANLPIATEDLVTTLRERNPITPTVPILSTPTLTTTAAVTATTGVTATDVLTSALPATDDLPATGGTPILVPTPVPASTGTDAGEDAAPGAATEEDAAPDAATETDSGEDAAPDAATEEETAATPAAEEPPSATVNANLRSGPDTTFDVVGGTVTGQPLTIVARNEDGSWFLLDNGGWVAAFLIANAPDPTTVPLFDGNTPVDVAAGEPVTPTATVTTTTPVTPTAVPTPTFGVQENLYVIRADGITDRYDFALTQAETLIAQAQADATILGNQEWIIQMTTMITLLRSAGDELESLTPPALFADAHAQLLQAVTAYNSAADLLAEGIDQLEVETLTEAINQINTGDQAVSLAQATIDTLTP